MNGDGVPLSGDGVTSCGDGVNMIIRNMIEQPISLHWCDFARNSDDAQGDLRRRPMPKSAFSIFGFYSFSTIENIW